MGASRNGGNADAAGKAMAKIARMVTRFHAIERGTVINFPIKWGKRIRFAGCDQGWRPATSQRASILPNRHTTSAMTQTAAKSPAMVKPALLISKLDI